MDLEAIETIRQVKAAYLRLLDLKEFTALGSLLTPTCTAAYDGGNLSFDGREAIVKFLTDSLGSPELVTQHNCHHPEIILDETASPDTDRSATGTWYLEDRVIIPAVDLEIAGTAIYSDRYAEIDGRWYISHTGYERIFEEHRTHTTGAVQSFKSRFAPSVN